MSTRIYIAIFIAYCFILQSCNGEESEGTSNFDLMATINTIKDKTKEVAGELGIKRPEDIPEVSDWMEQCKSKVGNRAWRVIRTIPNRILDCVSKYVKPEKIKIEVEDSMKKGELDIVFKKYCGRRDQIMDCIDDAIENVKPCLNEQQLEDLNVTRTAVDAGIDFICYENGDRIALFMAEEGIDCVKNNTEKIKSCIKSKIPELETAEKDPKSMTINQFLINEENCKKLSSGHRCIVSATESCDDPTPSNILDSLITQALKVTPCAEILGAISSSGKFYLRFWAFMPHFLIIIISGLTAAQILL